MSKIKVLDKALSIIDKRINQNQREMKSVKEIIKEINKEIYVETGFCDQDYNKFFSIVSSGSLTLSDYIRKRNLYYAVCDVINNPEKSLVDIAQNFGYSDQSAFSRAVKDEYGKPPGKLRKTKQEIKDNRKVIEGYLSNNSRLDSVIDYFVSYGVIDKSENDYFEAFIHATEEFGFDVATCCLISELSEKLDIPFATLLDRCFDIMIDCYSDPKYMRSHVDYAIDIGITSDKELDLLCEYFNCEYYELTEEHVQKYRKHQV